MFKQCKLDKRCYVSSTFPVHFQVVRVIKILMCWWMLAELPFNKVQPLTAPFFFVYASAGNCSLFFFDSCVYKNDPSKKVCVCVHAKSRKKLSEMHAIQIGYVLRFCHIWQRKQYSIEYLDMGLILFPNVSPKVSEQVISVEFRNLLIYRHCCAERGYNIYLQNWDYCTIKLETEVLVTMQKDVNYFPANIGRNSCFVNVQLYTEMNHIFPSPVKCQLSPFCETVTISTSQ